MENQITLTDFVKMLSIQSKEESKAMTDFWLEKKQRYNMNHIALFHWEMRIIEYLDEVQGW